jgi:hypothetical protein
MQDFVLGAGDKQGRTFHGFIKVKASGPMKPSCPMPHLLIVQLE